MGGLKMSEWSEFHGKEIKPLFIQSVDNFGL